MRVCEESCMQIKLLKSKRIMLSAQAFGALALFNSLLTATALVSDSAHPNYLRDYLLLVTIG